MGVHRVERGGRKLLAKSRPSLILLPAESAFAWEPGEEAGLISLWSEWWEFFLVADYIFLRWFELHLPHFI